MRKYSNLEIESDAKEIGDLSPKTIETQSSEKKITYTWRTNYYVKKILAILAGHNDLTYEELMDIAGIPPYNYVKILEKEGKVSIDKSKRPRVVHFIVPEAKPSVRIDVRKFDRIKLIEKYFPDVADTLGMPISVEELYKSKVQQVLKEEKRNDEFDVNKFVSTLLSREVRIVRYRRDPRLKVLYRLESEKYIDIIFPGGEARNPNAEVVFIPTPERAMKMQNERIKEKLNGLEKLEKSLTERRYYCGIEELCPACIGYVPSEIIELQDYKCPKGKDIIKALPEGMYDEIKLAIEFVTSQLMLQLPR